MCDRKYYVMELSQVHKAFNTISELQTRPNIEANLILIYLYK